MISPNIVAEARKAMQQQTKVNNAPAWQLTEIAVNKGRGLARAHGADENQVVVALYLAHAEFSDQIGGEIQKNHPALSAEFAKRFLQERQVPEEDIATVLNSIRAHHDAEPTKTQEAEIVKNAEAYKFVTVPGALVFLHDLGRRGMPLEAAAREVLRKLDQKCSYLTLPECKKEAAANGRKIRELMDNLIPATEPAQ